MNINERRARAKSPHLFDPYPDDLKKGPAMKNPIRKKRSPAQRAATAKLVALNRARASKPRRRNPSASNKRQTTTPRTRGDYIESAPRDTVRLNPIRALGHAVVSGGRIHSIWGKRPDAIAAGKLLADSLGAPVRVVAGSYAWTAD